MDAAIPAIVVQITRLPPRSWLGDHKVKSLPLANRPPSIHADQPDTRGQFHSAQEQFGVERRKGNSGETRWMRTRSVEVPSDKFVRVDFDQPNGCSSIRCNHYRLRTR